MITGEIQVAGKHARFSLDVYDLEGYENPQERFRYIWEAALTSKTGLSVEFKGKWLFIPPKQLEEALFLVDPADGSD